MALDHSRLSLESKFLENKSGRIFCVPQVYPTNSCQQIWVCANQPFILCTMRRCFYHTDLVQNAVVHNFSRQIASFNIQDHQITRGPLAKPFKKFPKSPIRPAGAIGVRAGGEGGCSAPKFWATQFFWAARENLGKARF